MLDVQITIRDTPKSKFLENYIRKRAQKISQFNQSINKCRVVVEMPQKHKHQGKLFRVSISLTVPGREIVVNRKLDEDVYVAVNESFEAIERKLENYAHRRVTEVRRRKRGSQLGEEFFERMETKRSEDSFKTKESNDEFYIDEVDTEYENIESVLKDENVR